MGEFTQEDRNRLEQHYAEWKNRENSHALASFLWFVAIFGGILRLYYYPKDEFYR